MPKFVLIDHSIVDVGGHYFEYAVRVLSAAEEAGYEPILATNRRLRDIGSYPWRVFPVYRYDFFEPGPSRLLAKVRGRLGNLRHLAARLKYRLLFSRPGLLWFKRREGSVSGAITSRWLLVAAVLAELMLCALGVAAAAWRLLLAVVPVGGYVRKVFRASRQLVEAAARPWRTFLGQGSVVWQQARRWRKRSAFAADSIRLFRKVRLDEGDVVLIPTLTEQDMMGLLPLFRGDGDTAKATWHLIFRRNIYQGRDPDYASQDESLRSLRNVFRRFQSQLRGQRVYFYTDTEPLTSQYNRLSVASFRTLPIPVAADYRVGNDLVFSDDRRGPAGSAERLFHVVYVGDARTEKGYHCLPHLVGDAFAAQLPVRFTFQSNFNVPRGEPAPAVARAQLEAIDKQCRVDLIKRPLASAEYRRLVLDGDVVVVPYDRDNYYARSSGIFAEALVAGKPVLVPAGTWMAAELNSAICDYHEAVRRERHVLAGFDAHELAWQTRLGKLRRDRDFADADGLPVLGNSPTQCWLRVPTEATHLLVSFKLGSQSRGVFPGIVSEHFASGRALLGRTTSWVGGGRDGRGGALIRLDHAARRIRLGLSNSLSPGPIALKDVRIEFLSTAASTPVSAVGATYVEPAELCQYLREIVTHYEHYCKTAAEFSRSWSAYHCPGRLIEQLTGGRAPVAAHHAQAADMSGATMRITPERCRSQAA
jgi:hypothetical protein